MPEEMEYPNIATMNKVQFAAVDMGTIPTDVDTLQEDSIALTAKANELRANMDLAGIHQIGCLSVETANGAIVDFTFTNRLSVPITAFISNSERVIVGDTLQIPAVDYTPNPATGHIVFIAGHEPATDPVMDCWTVPVWTEFE